MRVPLEVQLQVLQMTAVVLQNLNCIEGAEFGREG